MRRRLGGRCSHSAIKAGKPCGNLRMFRKGEFKHRRIAAPGLPGNRRIPDERGIVRGELRLLDHKRAGLRVERRGAAWGIEDIKIAWRVLRGETSAADGDISATKLAWRRARRTISSPGPKEAFIFSGPGAMGVKGARGVSGVGGVRRGGQSGYGAGKLKRLEGENRDRVRKRGVRKL